MAAGFPQGLVQRRVRLSGKDSGSAPYKVWLPRVQRVVVGEDGVVSIYTVQPHHLARAL